MFSFFVVCLILFNTSCGLDTYVIMEDPVSTLIHVPEYSSIQFQENYFEFYTKESGEYPNDFMFLGTEIYYKIYNNSSVMNQERATLESLASDEDTAAKAPEKLRYDSASGGYGFKQLNVSGSSEYPLIKASNPSKNQHVYIRLTDYQNLYSSQITVDGNSILTTGTSVPVRGIDKKYTFNFGRNGSLDKIPESSSEDVKYSSSFTEDNTWYVCLFAVAVGRDMSYLPYYSNITYLGCVPVHSDRQDN